MECCYIEVDNIAPVLNEGWKTARKQHTCVECRIKIAPGNEYYQETIVFDGGIQTHRTCKTCKHIRDDLMCGGWYWGQMYEDLEYCLGMRKEEMIGT